MRDGFYAVLLTSEVSGELRAFLSFRCDSQQLEEGKHADKGDDVLFVGIGKMRKAAGTFSPDVDRVAAGFAGPLVPVVGTETSRRGAEIAFALAPARSSRVTALHVAQRGGGAGTREPAGRTRSRRSAEKAVLDDVTELAKRYGHDEIQAAVRTDMAADAAIIEEARRSRADLIVIGASRRVGEALYLGETVASVLRQWKGAVVLAVM